MRPVRTYNSSSWTKEEDKAFENTLADYYGDSNVFRNIAAAVPQKSNQEILDHFNVLLEDINNIESGIVPLPKYRRMKRSSVARRKGIPWTAEEHRLFLQGLAKHGKGDWRGISRNFVLSRTPTQVASHAQKFFRRLKDNDDGRRRSSIHDITSAADITEPSSHGQESDELKGPCGGQSSVNPEKFSLGAALGSSELNSSFPGVDEFLRSIKDQITAPAEGPSGVYHGVDTRASRPLSLQPSVPDGTGMYTHSFSFPDVDEFQPDVDDRITVPSKGTSRRVDTRIFASPSLQPSVAAGGTGIYTHPGANVRYDLEELMTGSSQVGPSVNDASVPLPIANHIGVHSCTASSSGTKNNGALEGVFSVDSMQLPSVPVSSDIETYPCWYPSSKDDNMFDLDDLFPDHIFGFGK